MTDYENLYNEAPVGLWRTSIEDGKFLPVFGAESPYIVDAGRQSE